LVLLLVLHVTWYTVSQVQPERMGQRVVASAHIALNTAAVKSALPLLVLPLLR
jgi:hypothetical protein